KSPASNEAGDCHYSLAIYNFSCLISSKAMPTYVFECGSSTKVLPVSLIWRARFAAIETREYFELILFCNESIDGSNIDLIIKYFFDCVAYTKVLRVSLIWRARFAAIETREYFELILFCNESIDGSNIDLILQ